MGPLGVVEVDPVANDPFGLEAVGRSRIAEMAAGFYADVPDLSLTCDNLRCAGTHAIFVWTFTGHDAKTGNPLKVQGWEEWELGEDLKVKASLGWFDSDEYTRQVEGR